MENADQDLSNKIGEATLAVISLISKAESLAIRPDGANDAMKLTQAALNAANALSIFTMISSNDEISDLRDEVSEMKSGIKAIKAHLVALSQA